MMELGVREHDSKTSVEREKRSNKLSLLHSQSVLKNTCKCALNQGLKATKIIEPENIEKWPSKISGRHLGKRKEG